MKLKTLQDAILYFSDPVRCREYLVVNRWPDGVVCPRCGSKDVLFLEKYDRWHCRAKHDAPQFTLKTGTVMEDSPIRLEKWLPAFWLLANCKNGISSYELHRAIGVTQKTAWFMLHRIRLGDGSAGTPDVRRSRGWAGRSGRNLCGRQGHQHAPQQSAEEILRQASQGHTRQGDCYGHP